MYVKAVVLTLVLVISAYFLRDELSNAQDKISDGGLSDTYNTSETKAVFHNIPVAIPKKTSYLAAKSQNILGEKDSNSEKTIRVNLSEQKLYAYEGENKKMSFLVSTGKWGRTPTGEFKIWTKLKYTLMKGGSKALGTYYYLPNVPSTMYFYNEKIPKTIGYGIHGAYWHNNFGHPMSHGCINMRVEEAAKLFQWADVGTRVVIYGTAPKS